jgi:hypothetical protein
MLSLHVIGIRGAREAVAREERALARRMNASLMMVEKPGRLIARDAGVLRLECR